MSRLGPGPSEARLSLLPGVLPLPLIPCSQAITVIQSEKKNKGKFVVSDGVY